MTKRNYRKEDLGYLVFGDPLTKAEELREAKKKNREHQKAHYIKKAEIGERREFHLKHG